MADPKHSGSSTTVSSLICTRSRLVRLNIFDVVLSLELHDVINPSTQASSIRVLTALLIV
ncbi:hypothetical protein Sjap_003473 [Stephania japonica]|uniref:Uncharacterized protein n=1 Tax=Stephania japonica TaxID=461633 RepID=A0AAP0PTL2_9MAGN